MRSRTRCSVVAFALLLAPASVAAESPSIATLQIHGTRRPLTLETRAGEPLDIARVERDVRRLWATGWFEDIQVVTDDTPRGMQLTFGLTEKPRLYLRRVRFRSGGERHAVDLPERAVVDAAVAARVAALLQRDLVDQGYAEAKVEAELVPAGFRSADLLLKVNRGQLYEIEEVRFTGNTGLRPGELREALASIRPRRILPSLGPLWGGWRLRAPYSTARLQSEIEKLRSLYLSHGYFDSHIEVTETQTTAGGKVVVTLRIASGPRYNIARLEMPGGGEPVLSPSFSGGNLLGKEFCRCLARAREDSEKRGEMAFTPRIELAPVVEPPDAAGELGLPPPDGNPHVTATTRTEAGPVYRVGRIRFLGHHAVRDSTLRKALVLQEGDLFDAGRVRRSLARLNRLAPLQRVDPAGVLVEPIAERGLVNLTIPVKERPRGFWSLSGPLGPLSVFGPLSYTIGSRLPAAGQGPLELSTYYMTFSLLAWPLGSIFPALSRVGAVLALQRPQLPGQWWSSGILLAPQLGWRGAAAGYGVSHLTEAARTAMRADALPPPSLSIPVAWHPEHSSDGAQPVPIGFLQCAEPKPRWAWLRTAAATLMDSAMSWLLTSKLL